jgi:cytochrome c556
MKRIAIFGAVILAISLVSCNKMTPVEYNDTIVGMQKDIQKGVETLQSELASGDEAAINAAIDKQITKIDSSITALEELGAYDGEDGMQQAALNLFNMYKDFLENDYRFIASVSIKSPSDITEEDQQKLSDIMTKVSSEETKLDVAFRLAQNDFAEKHGITII